MGSYYVILLTCLRDIAQDYDMGSDLIVLSLLKILSKASKVTKTCIVKIKLCISIAVLLLYFVVVAGCMCGSILTVYIKR